VDRFKRILFYADGSRGEKSALGTAMDLAERNDATITVLDVVPHLSSNDPRLQPSINRLQDAVVEERFEKLDELIADLKQSHKPRKVDINIIPGDKGFIEVIKQIVLQEYDLLVKAADRTSAFTSRVFGNADMRFMRQCPCPVWIIKSGHRRMQNILAAVDVSDDSHLTMHIANRILSIATGLATLANSRVHVLSAYEHAVDPTIGRRMDSKIYKDLNDGYKHELRSRFENLTSKYAGKVVEDHLLRGKSYKVINKFVEDYDIDLLVMGTLSSTETPGLLMGSTAERVIHAIDCSVLTLKPEDFTTIIAQ
jgi:nucleotide-binding universal stress UspA family protein